MSYVTVTGRLLASHFQAGGEVPLTGQIFFTPTMGQVPAGESVHLPAPMSVELDGEGRFEVELLSAGFSWEVGFSLRHAGAFVPVDCFNFLPTPGVERVNFADIVPLTDPVTGAPMLRGEPGVGVSAITTAGGELIFTLTNGAETRIPVPQGIPGTGVEGITLEGDELVFALSDGSEERLPAPAGAPGKDAPKPNLAVGEVQTLPAGASATAEVTGMSPDFVLSLGVPAGANGDTPTITAGTVSTLPAGASATAELTHYRHWVWVKTPTGWSVTYGDTGWRDITVSAVDPANSQPGGRLFIRRVGNTVSMRLSKLAPLVGGDSPMVEGEWLPLGFRGVEQITFVLSDVGRTEGANGVVGRLSFSAWWKYRFPLRINLINFATAADAVGQFCYFTTETWPATQPGTPA